MRDAASLDAQIRELAAERAGVLPSHPAAPPTDPSARYQADNMLWHVRPAAGGTGVELALFHHGLGWVSVDLSRAQVQDMHDAVALALRALPARTNNRDGTS